MSRKELAKSLRTWTGRARSRRAKWRFYVKAEGRARSEQEKLEAREHRSHWFALYKEAKTMVARRTKQLASLRKGHMSDKGLTFLVREEGSIPYAYKDPVGWVTFGVGHLVLPQHKTITSDDMEHWGTPHHPRRDLVMPTLAKDLTKYEAAVRRSTGGRIKHSYQFDACVSLCFNIGTGGFEDSTVAAKIRAGKYQEAADAFLLWDNPSMLRPRRERERRLFLSGVYG
jgi:lysozyme